MSALLPIFALRARTPCAACRLRQRLTALSLARRPASSWGAGSGSRIAPLAVALGRRDVLRRVRERGVSGGMKRGFAARGDVGGLVGEGSEGRGNGVREDADKGSVVEDIGGHGAISGYEEGSSNAEDSAALSDEEEDGALERRFEQFQQTDDEGEYDLQDPDHSQNVYEEDGLPQAMPSSRVLCAAISEMYQRGQITRDDWRQSVLTLLEGESNQVLQGGLSEKDPEFLRNRVKMLMRANPDHGIPDGVLTRPEREIYHALLEEVVRTGGIAEDMDVEEEEPVLQDKEDLTQGLPIDENAELAAMQPTGRFLHPDLVLARDIQTAMDAPHPVSEPTRSDSTYSYSPPEPADEDDDADDSLFIRSHPLTVANRFSTSPSSIQFPASTFTQPITDLLRRVANSQLSEHTLKILGGPGLPFSPATPVRGKSLPKVPIPLDPYQSKMTEIEADVYLLGVMPGVYASVTSALVETRKRLGTGWAENLVRKAEAGELKILDAGGAGVGILAVRDLLRAEWERMHETAGPTALANPDGKLGGANAEPPLGHGTVLTASNALRYRASQLLDDTSFIPRLPDYVHASDTSAAVNGKFDIVIAPHSLFPIGDDNLRKVHVTNLWSLTRADSEHGGVLILLEKGIARGFELIAGAREMLLENHIASPGNEFRNMNINDTSNQTVEPPSEPHPSEKSHAAPVLPFSPANAVLHGLAAKEPGMIVAPCTNHASTCPMYQQKGIVKGRKDTCTFEQRFHRPAFLQRIYNSASARNFEDVQFSYISLLRGRDLRSTSSTPSSSVLQGHEATQRAFTGFESSVPLPSATNTQVSTTEQPHSLSLPRSVFPPLKRHGHVILDVCTPSGSLERWTVPRSFSKQAYRDARKSSLGDLWALGAKTRIPRNVKGGTAGGAPGAWEGTKRNDDDWEDQRLKRVRFRQGIARGVKKTLAGLDEHHILMQGLDDGDGKKKRMKGMHDPQFEQAGKKKKNKRAWQSSAGADA